MRAAAIVLILIYTQIASAFFFGKISEYEIYVPPGPLKVYPMVVVLHGCLQDGKDIAKITGFNDVAKREDFAVLYLSQPSINNPMRCWNWFLANNQENGKGELEKIDKTIKKVIKEHSIDPTRIYGTGISAGGATIANLAACYPNRFAGIAVHSAVSYGLVSNSNDAFKLLDEGPKPDQPNNTACDIIDYSGGVMILHGNGDTINNPLNSQRIKEDFLDHRRLVERFDAVKGNNYYDYQETKFINKFGEVEGLKLDIDELSHAWSGGADGHSYSDPDGPPVTELIWEFFSKF